MIARGLWLPLGIHMALFVLVADQLSKWVLLRFVMEPPRVIPVTPYFNLVPSWNKGVSFGFFRNALTPEQSVWVFVGTAVLVLAFLLRWLYRAPSRLVALGLGMVIGGATGNVMDRLQHGAVFDFLDFHAYGWHWYAFNLADASIVAGVALLLGESLVRDGLARRAGKR